MPAISRVVRAKAVAARSAVNSVGRLEIDGGSGVDEGVDDPSAPREGGDHERGHTVFAAPVGVDPFGNESFDVIGVTELRVEQQVLRHFKKPRAAPRGPRGRCSPRADRRARSERAPSASNARSPAAAWSSRAPASERERGSDRRRSPPRRRARRHPSGMSLRQQLTRLALDRKVTHFARGAVHARPNEHDAHDEVVGAEERYAPGHETPTRRRHGNALGGLVETLGGDLIGSDLRLLLVVLIFIFARKERLLDLRLRRQRRREARHTRSPSASRGAPSPRRGPARARERVCSVSMARFAWPWAA